MRVYLAASKDIDTNIRNIIISIFLTFFAFILYLIFLSGISPSFFNYYLRPDFSTLDAPSSKIYLSLILFFPFWILFHFRVLEYHSTGKSISVIFTEVLVGKKARTQNRIWSSLLMFGYIQFVLTLIMFLLPKETMRGIFNFLGI